jgi:oligopeptidase A
MVTAAGAPAAAPVSTNPLVQPFALPPFSKIAAGDVVPGMTEILARYRADVAAHEAAVGAASEHTWESVIVPTYFIEHQLSVAWGAVSHLLGVCNSDELRQAHEAVQPEVVKATTLLKQSRPLYDGARAIRDSPQFAKLSGPQQKVLSNVIRDAQLAGVGLDGAERERFNAVLEESAQLGTKFSNNVLDSTKAYSLDLTDPADVDGLPDSAREQLAAAAREGDVSKDATAAAGPWRVTLAAPVVIPFLTHATRRDLREKIYRAYVTRASSGDFDNAPLIDRILALRAEKARLLGYKTYAEVSLSTKMAESVDEVHALLDELLEKSHSTGKQELAELCAFAKSKGAPEGDDMQNWDAAFWAERMREERYAFSEETLRSYFPLDKVLGGLFGLIDRLFQVKVVDATDDSSVDRWHPDVRFFKLFDSTGAHIASFFLDPYSRPGLKRGGAWMDNAKDRSAVLRDPDGSRKLPVAYLVCNGSPPVGGKPSLLTFRDAETLFHEAGHGLQAMLTSIDEQDVSGLNGIEWDAVETASQFNEHWCYHKPTLSSMTGHYETGKPLPDELYEKLVKAKTYRSASAMMRQLYFAMTDLALHSTYDPAADGTPFDLMKKVGLRTNVLPALPEDRFLCCFSHIFAGGYASGVRNVPHLSLPRLGRQDALQYVSPSP